MPKKTRFICVSLVLCFFLIGCSGNVQESLVSQSTLTYILANEPGNIDPQISTEDETATILRQIYDTLVYRDPVQQTIVPGLATQWTISPDNLTYTFSLRQDVVFHDGNRFDAQAVAQNFERIAKLKLTTSRASLLLSKYYAGYEVVDDFTISFKLTQPYAPFLDAFSQPYLGISSPTALTQYSSNRYQFHQIGTGPFVLVDYIPGNRIILHRNPNYKWGPSFYSPTTEDSVNDIEFEFVPNAKQRLDAINGRDVNVVTTSLLPSDARSLTVNPNVQIFPAKVSGQPLQFFMNTSRFPTDNLAFRQALLYSANRNFILDTVLQRFSSIGWGPITSNTPYYNGQLDGVYATDTGKAQSLLTSIGYTDSDNNKFLDLAGAEAGISIIIQSGILYPDIAKDLAEQWRLIGIKATIVAVPTLTALRARVDTNEYNLAAFSISGTDPSILDDFFVPTAQNNWSKVSDAQLADLLGQGTLQTDVNARRDIYTQVQQQVMNLALILPIGEPVLLNAADKSIQKLTFDSVGVPFLNNVTIAQ
jgi:peptide/nickel transport system substrate-binding protein